MPRSTEKNSSGMPGKQDELGYRHFGDGIAGQFVAARLQAYNSTSLAYEDVALDNATGGIVTSGGGGGGGGAVTVADGADVAQGATADVAWVSGAGSLIAISKAEFAKLEAIRALLAGSLTVGSHNVTNAGTFAVQATGTVTANAGTNLNTSALALDATLTGGTQKSKLVDTAGVNAAAVSAAGRLSVDASGVAVPVTDNAGSITVDAPVGTPVSVQEIVGGAAIDPRSIRALTTADAITATIAAASDASKAEDAAALSGDRGIFNLGVRDDTLGTTATTSANGDYTGFAVDHIGRQIVRETPTDQIATTISSANATVTLTISAAGAGLKHYITGIKIVNINPTTTAIAAAATTLSYTTTNIPGSLAWSAGTALAASAEKVITDEKFSSPIKTTTAATNTTIVAPAIGTGGLCRITCYFYIAP